MLSSKSCKHGIWSQFINPTVPGIDDLSWLSISSTSEVYELKTNVCELGLLDLSYSKTAVHSWVMMFWRNWAKISELKWLELDQLEPIDWNIGNHFMRCLSCECPVNMASVKTIGACRFKGKQMFWERANSDCWRIICWTSNDRVWSAYTDFGTGAYRSYWQKTAKPANKEPAKLGAAGCKDRIDANGQTIYGFKTGELTGAAEKKPKRTSEYEFIAVTDKY